MIAVISRVRWARVKVSSEVVGEIESGILTLLGIEKGDTEDKVNWLIEKILGLRIFEDADGKMNQSLVDIKGEHLIVSQFTLAADCSSGRRPSFMNAESPDLAKALYLFAVEQSKKLRMKTATGIFQAEMEVESLNHGPATFILRK